MTLITSVFLIDDDKTSNLINTEILRIFDKSIQVTSFMNAAIGLEELKTISLNNPDKIPSFIFLDINMPVIDGWGFLETLKTFNTDVLKNCKVYILTSSIDPEDVDKARNFKMVQGFISKPLTITHLRLITQGKKSGDQYLSHLKFFYPTNTES